MLYSEFIEGTGCRENDHNYQVYKNLEIMYMNSQMSKQEIYEYGKKLVDNSKSPEQIKFEEEIQAQISLLQDQLKSLRADIKRYDEYYQADKTDKFWKDQRDWSKKCAQMARRQISELKWILGLN